MKLARCAAVLLSFLAMPLLLSVPVVTYVSPNHGPAAGGDSITITGSGFLGADKVFFGPTEVAVLPTSDTEITVNAPLSVPGTVHITVQADSGTSATTPADRYTYQGSWFAYVTGQAQGETGGTGPSQYPAAWCLNCADHADTGKIPLTENKLTCFGIAITPDGRASYVAGDSSSEQTGPTVISRINLVDRSTTGIECEGWPLSNYIAISPDGANAYCTLSPPFAIPLPNGACGSIDLATHDFEIAFPTTGSPPLGVGITPDGGKIYVANFGFPDGSVTVFPSGTTGTITGLTGPGPGALAITPNGGEVYLCANEAYNIYVIDTASDTLGDPIALGTDEGPTDVAISPDGAYAYVTSGAAVHKIRTSDKQLFEPIECTGDGLQGIAITPDGKKAYVAQGWPSETNNILAIDLTSNEVETIAVLDSSDLRDVAITPDQAPAAEFSATIGASGTATVFDASRSVSPVGTIVKYEWDFGDGSPTVETTEPTVSHTYANSGTYTVRLTVTNSAGTSITQTFTGQTVSNNGSENAQYELLITVPSDTPSHPRRPRHFRGKAKKRSHHTCCLKTRWKNSNTEEAVKYQIYKKNKRIYTTTKLRFKRHLHPKHFYWHHLHDYKKRLEKIYRIRAVNAAGEKSSFRKLEVE